MSRATYTAKQFIDAIPGTGGIITAIAERVGCTWNTAQKWIRDKPSVQEAYQNECERINDMAQSILMKSIKAGNAQDAKWWLSKKRKSEFGESLGLDFKVDMSALTDSQLDRIAKGENILSVLTASSIGRTREETAGQE